MRSRPRAAARAAPPASGPRSTPRPGGRLPVRDMLRSDPADDALPGQRLGAGGAGVVVGAGHLVGNKGIIELLKRKGYIVEQI